MPSAAMQALVAKGTLIKNAAGVTLFAGAIVMTVLAYAKVPAKLDQLITQQDSLYHAQTTTNHLLTQVICIEAKVSSAAGCLLK